MTDIYQVRIDRRGGFAIFKNDTMLIYNLDNNDIANFSKEHRHFGLKPVDEIRADFDTKVSRNGRHLSVARRPGRQLILTPHVHLFRSMIEHNAATTAKDIEKRLRSLGIKFNSLSAVTNLARRHNLKLAA